jgi:hypothetical protein
MLCISQLLVPYTACEGRGTCLSVPSVSQRCWCWCWCWCPVMPAECRSMCCLSFQLSSAASTDGLEVRALSAAIVLVIDAEDH